MHGPSIIPEHDETVYLVLDDHGPHGMAYAEADPTMADRESVIADLIEGQFTRPVRVVAFNIGRNWSDDVSREIAEEIQRRLDYVDLPDPVRSFVDRYTGSEQLSLRLR
jgi:uncharacterized NAD-dependent epimerase/dehydratase family protein